MAGGAYALSTTAAIKAKDKIAGLKKIRDEAKAENWTEWDLNSITTAYVLHRTNRYKSSSWVIYINSRLHEGHLLVSIAL